MSHQSTEIPHGVPQRVGEDRVPAQEVETPLGQPLPTRFDSFQEHLCLHVFEVSFRRACRIGLDEDAAQDCAMEFVETMLLSGSHASSHFLSGWQQAGLHADAWLRRCADNFAKNARRRELRQSRLVCHVLLENDGLETQDLNFADLHFLEGVADNTPSCDRSLLQGELWQLLWTLIGQLDSIPQEYFVRHCLDEEAIVDIALSVGKAPEAVRKTVFRARRQLCGRLLRHGIGEADLRLYLEPGQ